MTPTEGRPRPLLVVDDREALLDIVKLLRRVGVAGPALRFSAAGEARAWLAEHDVTATALVVHVGADTRSPAAVMRWVRSLARFAAASAIVLIAAADVDEIDHWHDLGTPLHLAT